MADVFISYCREDRPLTEALARELEQSGYTVWWDTDLLPYQSFREAIDRELDSASAVIIVWTKRSAASLWVQSEADHALREHKLVNVCQQGFRKEDMPKPFNLIHAVSLDERMPIL